MVAFLIICIKFNIVEYTLRTFYITLANFLIDTLTMEHANLANIFITLQLCALSNRNGNNFIPGVLG